ncbi:metal-dependent transcriptional regulator [Halobacterium jilantaiense]|uniref:Iron (Metal) dependent repressor, DtxR family n=1 Tax=Halobacterium jilantaiense TaxID=355548 RepID=A0A1I0PG99_9EURY|nr:metal-dependent transcriptional regulator [Halobacterium jilantaiense]SEW12673.1 iron (metal) dependent repressor, DtxR family [Halobacterium jilantaiense]
MEPEVSAADGRYLAAVFAVGTVRDRPAETGDLAAALDVSPGTVTERLRDLASRDLVDYERYHGAELTETGEQVARELAWRRCLAENFLDGELDLTDADVDGIGRALSEDAAAALGDRVDHPCSEECGAPDDRFPECTVYSMASR